MVKKRTWSSCSEHVDCARWNERENLRCFLPGATKPQGKKHKVTEPDYFWFHQEYIESLKSFGEFRVILSRGRVVAMCRTTFAPDTEELIVQPVKPSDFEAFSPNVSDQERKCEELREYAEYICSQLLTGKDAYLYKSFEIGGRIDIGISENSPAGKFFVLELTRFHAAGLFSYFILTEPWSSICEAWAKALVYLYSR